MAASSAYVMNLAANPQLVIDALNRIQAEVNAKIAQTTASGNVGISGLQNIPAPALSGLTGNSLTGTVAGFGGRIEGLIQAQLKAAGQNLNTLGLGPGVLSGIIQQNLLGGSVGGFFGNTYNAAKLGARSDSGASIIAAQNPYIQSLIDATLSHQAESIAVKQGLLATSTYAEQQVQLQSLKAQETAAVNQLLLTTRANVLAEEVHAEALTARAAALKANIFTGQAAAGVDPGGLIGLQARQSAVAASVAQAQKNALLAAEQTSGASSAAYIQAKTEETANRQLLNAQLKAELLVNPEYIAAQQLLAATKLKELQSSTAADLATQGAIAAQTKINASQVKIAETRILTEEENLRLKAQEILIQREYNAALQRSVSAELAAQGRPFASTLARFGAGGYSVGQGGATGASGFFGGGLLSTLKYSLPSLLLFGAFAGIGGAVKDAEELQKTFSLLRAQLDSIGQGDSFEGLREDILEISRDTGVAAEQVAKFAVTLQGAFGQGTTLNGRSGQDLVQFQTEQVTQLDRLLDLNDKQVLDSTLALGVNFEADAQQIKNVVFQVRQETGVAAEEILSFLADIAPPATEAGFSLAEISAIGATAIQSSGKGASAISEQLGRILPAITSSKEELLQLAAANESLNNQEFLEAIGSGNTAVIFEQLGTNFENLDKNAQDFVVSLLGGRREAQTILSVFKDFSKVDSLTEKIDPDNAAAADRAYKELQQTLGQTAAELGQVLKQLALEFLDAGLADALKLVLDTLKGIAQVLTTVLGLLGDVNSSLGGVPVLAGLGYGAYSLAAARIPSSAPPVAAPAPSGIILPPGVVPPTPTPPASASRFANFTSGGGATLLATLAASFAVGKAFETYENYDSKVEGAANFLKEQLKTANEEQLRQLVKDQDSVWESVANAIFGEESVSELASKELTKRESATNRGKVETIAASTSDSLKERAEKLLQESLSYDRTELVKAANQGDLDAIDEMTNGLNEVVRLYLAEIAPKTYDVGSYGATFRDFDPTKINLDTLKAISADAEGGDKGAKATLDFLLKTLPERDPELANLLNAILSGDEAKVKLADRLDKRQKSLESSLALYEAGGGSGSQVNAAYSRYLATLRQAANAGDEQTQLLYLQTLKESQQFFVEDVKKKNEFASAISGIGQTELESLDSQLNQLLALLSDPKLTDQGQTQELIIQVIELQRNIFQSQLDNMETGVEKLAFLNSGGAELDPELYTALIEAQLNNVEEQWGQLLNEYASFFDENTRSLLQSTIAAGINGDATLSEVLSQLSSIGLAAGLGGSDPGGGDESVQIGGSQLSSEIQKIIERINDAKARGLSDAEAIQEAFNVIIPGKSFDATKEYQEAQEQAKREAEEAAREAERAAEEAEREAEEARQAFLDLANARFEYAKIIAGDDSAAVANISLEQANFALQNATTDLERQQAINDIASAERAQRDAAIAIADANATLASALSAGDEFTQALIALSEAGRAMSEAEGQAEILNAEAERVKADRQFIDTIRALTDARSNLAKALAESIGDVVGASQISVQDAQRNLDEARADFAAGFADQGDVDNAQAELVRAIAADRDTRLQDQLGDYQFLFDMEKISKSQYIQYLKSLKQLPDLTEQQIRDIDRQIKQLSSDLQQDLQFNLPTNLALPLPTLYEGRRSLTNAFSGAGYVDNRNVQINVNVNNEADRAKVTQIINDALAQPRSGTALRRY